MRHAGSFNPHLATYYVTGLCRATISAATSWRRKEDKNQTPAPSTLTIDWDAGSGRIATLALTSGAGLLIRRLLLKTEDGHETTIATDLTPTFAIREGTREAPPGRPPGMSIWNTFFDNPGKRLFQTHAGIFTPTVSLWTVKAIHERR